MSFLLSGKIETIKTNVATLISRLTSARATALDNLDATISSRAASSTALSSAVWTGTKAGYLDAPVSGAGQRVPSALPAWAPTTQNQVEMDTVFDSAISNISQRYPRFSWASDSCSTLATWEDIINITGPGVMQFLAVWQDSNASDRDADLRIVIDGTTVLTVTAMWRFSAARAKQGDGGGGIFVGFMEWNTTSGGLQQGSIALESLVFNTSFVVQHQITEAGGGTRVSAAMYRHYLT